MRLFKIILEHFQSNKTLQKIPLALLTLILLVVLSCGMFIYSCRTAYHKGYEEGRNHPRYIFHETDSTFSFVHLD